MLKWKMTTDYSAITSVDALNRGKCNNHRFRLRKSKLPKLFETVSFPLIPIATELWRVGNKSGNTYIEHSRGAG